jgi:DNA polymerase-1
MRFPQNYERLDIKRGLRWLEKPEPATYVVGFDVETYTTQPGLLIPKLVCASFVWDDNPGNFQRYPDGLSTPDLVELNGEIVFAAADAYAYFKKCLLNPQVTIVAHNAAFDLAVMALHALQHDEADGERVFEAIILAYEQGRIRCTLVRQKLIDIAAGAHKYHWDPVAINKKTGQPGKKVATNYRLEQLVWRHCGEVLPKEGTWREHFDRLDGVPVSEYPDEAYFYSLMDSVQGLKVFNSQHHAVQWDDEEAAGQVVVTIPDEIRQTCSAFALYLMSAHGLRTHKERSLKLASELKKRVSKAYAMLKQWGLVRGKEAKSKAGSKDMQAIYRIVEEAFAEAGLPCPKTKTGKAATDKESLERVALLDGEHDQLIEDYDKGRITASDERWTARAKLSVLSTIAADNHTLKNFVPNLMLGIDRPSNPFWNVLVESGRTSCRKPNWQNPPRKGGIRECVEARPGFVFISADYDTVELRTLAQITYLMFGHSEMREAMLRGEDLHSSFAAGLMGIDYAEFMRRLEDGDDECADQRQFAKIVNFGAPGGLGAPGLVGYAKGYGVDIDLNQARRLLKAWKRRWPEMVKYFAYVKGITAGGEGVVTQIPSMRVRGGCRYTSACNTFFQGLAADGAKDAIWRVMKECYVDKTSPLYGCRLTLFLHDELILECPWGNSDIERKRASNAAKRLQAIMVEALQVWIPDIPAKSSPVMTKRWLKGAKPVYEAGVMVPSTYHVEKLPDGKKKTTWVADHEFMEAA